tara:strand:+ start:27077 stop:27712 length:636 start_codon:yes stop_codon:yes gene_type:complete
MSYIRTDDIRQKQSATMKRIIRDGVIDQQAKVKKQKETIEKRKEQGLRFGRPSKKDGGVYPLSGSDIPCPICGVLVYYKRKELQEGKKKHCSRKCLHLNPEYKQKLKNADKSYMQTEAYKNTKRKSSTPDFKRYKNEVHRLSEKTYQQNVAIINPEGYNRTLAGVPGGYQLDHIVEVRYGFEKNISAQVISSVDNLRMLTWQDNLARNRRS